MKGVDFACPYCMTQGTYGPENLAFTTWSPCGLSSSEHRRVVKAWRQAQARAEKQVRSITFQSRMSTLYPKAVIKAVYEVRG
jgi:hypothetical protein